MQLAPQQDQAAKAVDKWLKKKGAKQFFYLAGFAGTGKTTIARKLAEDAGEVVFGAFTGKASLVLQSKGCRGAKTIHSMIYKLSDPDSAVPEFVINRDSEVRDADLVIIDEVSMVGEDLATDILSFGKKVLVLGDPAQLPAVGGAGYFTAGDPDFMLTDVHRQAADNPIIRMSMDVRQGRKLSVGSYGESRVIMRDNLRTEEVLAADQVLVGLNLTRRKYNQRVRKLRGFEGEFMPMERVVCLKNNREKGLLNGGIWAVDEIRLQDANETRMVVSPLDSGMNKTPVEVFTHHAWIRGEEQNLNWREQRNYDPFDYGYCLSVHKAQGSQWDNVLVFDESASFREDAKRWAYTALTRAAEKVTWVI